MRIRGWIGFYVVACIALTAGSPLAEAADAPCSASSPLGCARVIAGSEQAVTVVYVDRIVNRSEATIQSPQIRMHTPVKVPQQTVTQLDVEGKPKSTVDRWGSTVLVYQRKELKPGQVMTGRWTATATIRQFEWDLSGSGDAANSGADAFSADQQALYLRDAEAFALNDPVLQTAAQDAARARSGSVAVLEGIFDLVMDRLKYVRDGRWAPAPKVLAAGEGSCSEYTYCFVALCRANGIPARYVGGFIGRAGQPFHVDTVYHRYSQAYLPGIGWVDFDPTRTDGKPNHRLYFGRTSSLMLLTCVGDGGEGSLSGWHYLGAHQWNGPKTAVAASRVGWWFRWPPADVRQQVAAFRQRLAKTSGKQRPALVEQALAIAHPFVLPWLDDLLYEPASRVRAAEVCLKIGGDRALHPLVNCLGHPADREGDRQIGELLNNFTGQTCGTEVKKWKEWLKTRPAAGPSRREAPP